MTKSLGVEWQISWGQDGKKNFREWSDNFLGGQGEKSFWGQGEKRYFVIGWKTNFSGELAKLLSGKNVGVAKNFRLGQYKLFGMGC